MGGGTRWGGRGAQKGGSDPRREEDVIIEEQGPFGKEVGDVNTTDLLFRGNRAANGEAPNAARLVYHESFLVGAVDFKHDLFTGL